MTSDRVDPRLTGLTTELLQTLIRNQCVNDGTATSGNEVRNADALCSVLEDAGAQIETYEPAPGRRSIAAHLTGSDPHAPTTCWMGHTDVVPASPESWSRDPFGGELVNGEVWGRGAVDMLNVTASMAVAFAHLLRTGVRPPGDIIFLGVADEEAGGAHGAEYLCDHHWDEIACDYVLTEVGGFSMGPGPAVAIATAEKGVAWTRLRVSGTSGHGSMPLGADNALVKAAEVIRRLDAYRPAPILTETWHAMVEASAFPEALAADLRDVDRITELCEGLGRGLGSGAHACTHTTFSPNVAVGGTKTNVIPDAVDIEVDIRTMPGETEDEIAAHLHAALGDLADHVVATPIQRRESTSSPTNTPMWNALGTAVAKGHPGARLVPNLLTGGTDSAFFRRRGAVAYGAALFSRRIDSASFGARFHGNDERIDVESLGLTTQLWIDLATMRLHDT